MKKMTRRITSVSAWRGEGSDRFNYVEYSLYVKKIDDGTFYSFTDRRPSLFKKRRGRVAAHSPIAFLAEVSIPIKEAFASALVFYLQICENKAKAHKQLIQGQITIDAREKSKE